MRKKISSAEYFLEGDEELLRLIEALREC